MKVSIQEVIKTNWKNQVRFYWEGGTFTELKQFVSQKRSKEERSYKEWLVRKSPEFKNKVNSIYYS